MARTCQQNTSIRTPKSTSVTFLEAKAQQYLRPLEDRLLEQIDKRLVATFSALFSTILLFRNTKMGLLLSESGGYIAGYEHAPAGTKRMAAANRQQSLTVQALGDLPV